MNKNFIIIINFLVFLNHLMILSTFPIFVSYLDTISEIALAFSNTIASDIIPKEIQF